MVLSSRVNNRKGPLLGMLLSDRVNRSFGNPNDHDGEVIVQIVRALQLKLQDRIEIHLVHLKDSFLDGDGNLVTRRLIRGNNRCRFSDDRLFFLCCDGLENRFFKLSCDGRGDQNLRLFFDLGRSREGSLRRPVQRSALH